MSITTRVNTRPIAVAATLDFVGVLIFVVVGMLLRNLVFDRGTATSFIIVTTLFLGAALLGWRAIFRTFRRSATRLPNH